MATIIEYFTLRAAAAEVAKTSEDARRRIGRALSIGRQKAEASDLLWANGHAAEALSLAAAALESLLSELSSPDATAVAAASNVEGDLREATSPSVDVAADADASPDAPTPAPTSAAPASSGASAPWRVALAARGVSSARLDALEALRRSLEGRTMPVLDADVRAEDAALYEDLVSARLEVGRALATAAMSRREVAWVRTVRGAIALVVLVGVGVGVSLATRRPTGPSIQASDVFGQSPQYGAPLAFDGRDDTEWLLPDHASGWIETRLPAPQRVSAVSLTNADNPPHFDRATREYRVELYAGDRVVGSVDGVFADLEHDPAPRRVAVDGDEVDRVRVVVRSTHGVGGGLAEVHVEP